MRFFAEISGIENVVPVVERVITLTKPTAGASEVYRVAPGEMLNLAGIATENVTLVKLGSRLVVLFPDKSFVVVDGLYLPDGTPSPNVQVGLDATTAVSATQFVAQFPISTDEQILTAAGINAGPRGSGGIVLAAGPPGSALSVMTDLTPDVDFASALFDPLQESTSGQDTRTQAAGTPAGLNPTVPDLLQQSAGGQNNPAQDTPPDGPVTSLGPTARGDAAAVSEAGVNPGNTLFAGTPNVVGNLVANDTVSLPVTVTGVLAGAAILAAGNVGAAVSGTYGQLTLNSAGDYIYTLDNVDPATQALAQGVTAQEIFTYTVQDTLGQTSTASLVVTITGTNDAPVITSAPGADFGTVTEAGFGKDAEMFEEAPTATGTLSAVDVDTNAVLTWSGSADGALGQFTINPTTGEWTYTLNNELAVSLAGGETANEIFTVTVTDEFGATGQQNVTILVNGTNDAPRLDLDTTAFGSGYTGITASEAARSSDVALASVGASIVKRDEENPELPGQTSITDPDTTDCVTRISASIGFASGDRGVLVLDPAVAAAYAALIMINGDGSTTLEITSAAGLSACDARAILDGVRYVNTDRTFALDTNDRTIFVSIEDRSGISDFAIATVPVIADVNDTTGLNAFTGTRFDDVINGLGGTDTIDGREGNNTISGGDGDDVLSAGNGNNIINGDTGDDAITVGDGDNTINGQTDDDSIIAGNGNNTINGGEGDDSIIVGSGGNLIHGDGGDDNIVSEGSTILLTSVHGDGGDDTITTGNGLHAIFGGEGDDIIIAGNGEGDSITGGQGADRITTGDGADRLIFADILTEGGDTITDFASGTDIFLFTAANIGTGLATGGADTGTLDASRFVAGADFTNDTQRFLFNTADNTLYYDADGSGAAEAAVALALLENGGAMAAADIRIT